MIFAHDTEVALNAAAALINTAHGSPRRDSLDSVAALSRFIDDWGWTGARAGDAAELAEVRALRPRLEAIWWADKDEAVQIVNQLLAEAQAVPQLVRHGGWDYHLHATSDQAPLAQRMAVEAAMAVTDVIRLDEFERLSSCGAEDCDDVLVDLSKNRSRRFCSTTCANRTHVAAYRARRAG